MLTTLLTPNVIQVVESATDWQDAIKIACSPLVNNKFIEPRYIDAIIKSHEKIGILCIRTWHCDATRTPRRWRKSIITRFNCY